MREPAFQCLLEINSLLLNRAAVGWAVSCSAFGLFLFFYFFVSEQTQTPTRPIVITG